MAAMASTSRSSMSASQSKEGDPAAVPSEAGSSSTTQQTSSSEQFDIVKHYAHLLEQDDHLAMPVAAIESLSQVIARSQAETMSELINELTLGAAELQQASFNPVSLTAGADLLLRFVTLQRPSFHQPFSVHKRNLVSKARDFVTDSQRCLEKIVGYATGLVKDDAVIMTHSYSRVVAQTLLQAAKQRKRFKVYVTEARPFGLGVKTHAILTKAGIPCQVIVDSAVHFAMSKVDFVMLGAEALAENGGLVNFIGSSQMALIAKSAEKPVYALTESFKFLRIFPLNQYDLPIATPILRFSEHDLVADERARREAIKVPHTPSKPLVDSPTPRALEMTVDQVENNPLIDYTTPDLVTLVISDVGILTPSGVSDTLLRIFSG